MDFKDDVVLVRHDGPGRIAIEEGKKKVHTLKFFVIKNWEGDRHIGFRIKI